MITLGGGNNSSVNIHQQEADKYEVSTTDTSGSTSICHLSEKQIKTLAETLNNYLDI